MKTRVISAAALVLAAVLATPATAGISTGNLALDVRSAVGSEGTINVTLDDGVATLTGHTDHMGAAAAARRAAANHADVDTVVDLINAS